MSTEAVAAVIDVLIIEIVMGGFAKYRRTVRSAFPLSNIAWGIANFNMFYVSFITFPCCLSQKFGVYAGSHYLCTQKRLILYDEL